MNCSNPPSRKSLLILLHVHIRLGFYIPDQIKAVLLQDTPWISQKVHPQSSRMSYISKDYLFSFNKHLLWRIRLQSWLCNQKKLDLLFIPIVEGALWPCVRPTSGITVQTQAGQVMWTALSGGQSAIASIATSFQSHSLTCDRCLSVLLHPRWIRWEATEGLPSKFRIAIM